MLLTFRIIGDQSSVAQGLTGNDYDVLCSNNVLSVGFMYISESSRFAFVIDEDGSLCRRSARMFDEYSYSNLIVDR